MIWARISGMFQSTHSLRSATVRGSGRPRSGMQVSIHALLAECDTGRASEVVSANSFNPRTPCGVRPIMTPPILIRTLFQSTHSLRSATLGVGKDKTQGSTVSIHALLAECDKFRQDGRAGKSGFNPRTPCGVRLISMNPYDNWKIVSIHALLAECDSWRIILPCGTRSFNPRTPCGVRHALLPMSLWGFMTGFNPRTPCGVRLAGW